MYYFYYFRGLVYRTRIIVAHLCKYAVFSFLLLLMAILFMLQQALPVDLSNTGIRSHGSVSFHSTSAFDPCCPGSSSRSSVYGHQSTASTVQTLAIDGYGPSMVAQAQAPPQTSLSSCRHFMHAPCRY